jgi:RNA recognition motif-containing protein
MNRIESLEKEVENLNNYISGLNELLIKKNIVTEEEVKEILSEVYNA